MQIPAEQRNQRYRRPRSKEYRAGRGGGCRGDAHSRGGQAHDGSRDAITATVNNADDLVVGLKQGRGAIGNVAARSGNRLRYKKGDHERPRRRFFAESRLSASRCARWRFSITRLGGESGRNDGKSERGDLGHPIPKLRREGRPNDGKRSQRRAQHRCNYPATAGHDRKSPCA